MVVYSFYIFDRHGQLFSTFNSSRIDTQCSGMYLQAEVVTHRTFIRQINSTSSRDDGEWQCFQVSTNA
jgi:hypothetical protein